MNEAVVLERVQELSYLGMCFNESMRLEPPVPVSSSVKVTEDVKLGGINFKKDDKLQMGMG